MRSYSPEHANIEMYSQSISDPEPIKSMSEGQLHKSGGGLQENRQTSEKSESCEVYSLVKGAKPSLSHIYFALHHLL